MRNYTLEEIQFVKKKIIGRSYTDMLDLFNEHFCLRGKKKLTVVQMKGVLQRHNLCNGLPRYFQPGHIPHNKGVKGFCTPGLERSQYKPGNIPFVRKPIGAERRNGYGYVEVKIAHPNMWKSKHAVIWEKANGPVPKGKIIIFADGNKMNFDLENLLMISRGELATMNRNSLIYNNTVFTKAGKLVADIKMLTNKRKREAKKSMKPGAKPKKERGKEI
jgi:hypothetical protein